MPATPDAPTATSRLAKDEPVNPADAERAVFARLTPLLARYGLEATVVEHDTPLLLVTNDGRPATFVYVAMQPLLHELAVYGFVDLYLGVVADLERVAARLAWLLGVPLPTTTPNPPNTRNGEEDDA